MAKQAPSFGRIAVMVIFVMSCFGLLLFLWTAFGGPVPFKPHGYRFKASFDEATQLAQESDVRISGVSVGKVKKLTLVNGLTQATIEMDSKYAPVAKDTRAILRQKTLLGETYVELTPGSPSGPKLAEGGELAQANVEPTVELDEIFQVLDPKTREDFRIWMQDQGRAIDNRGQDFNDALGNLAPFAEDTNQVLEVLDTQERAVQRLVKNTGVVFAALTERGDQLRQLIVNSDTVFAATASRNAALADAITIFPTFLDESTRTLARLDRFAKDNNANVRKQIPVAQQLSPLLKDTVPFSKSFRGFIFGLEPLIKASKNGLPALSKFLDQTVPLLGQLQPFLRNLNPMLEFLGAYKREITAFVGNDTAATQAQAQVGGTGDSAHYLRTTNPLNPETLAVIQQKFPSTRSNPYVIPGNTAKLGNPALEVLQTAGCNNFSGQVPQLLNTPPPSGNYGPFKIADVYSLLNQFVFKEGQTPISPPCNQQAPFTFNGFVGSYPHVLEEPP